MKPGEFMDLTGGELSALQEIEHDRQRRLDLRAAQMALWAARYVWAKEHPTPYEMIGEDAPATVDSEAQEDAAFDAIWALAAKQQGAEVGH
ncbi:MAG TPA: hypothetical protein DCP69_01375 [Candidatus Omnitrophica bacterium]|nr:hypothetical protein [Candidatus Omnitrophota bacterium]